MKKILSACLTVIMLMSLFPAGSVVSAGSESASESERVLWVNYTENSSVWVRKQVDGKWTCYRAVKKTPYKVELYRTKISENETEYTYTLELRTEKDGVLVNSYTTKELKIAKEYWNDYQALASKDAKLNRRYFGVAKLIGELQATINLYNKYKGYIEDGNPKALITEFLPAYCDVKIEGLNNELMEALKEQANMTKASEDAIKATFGFVDHPYEGLNDYATGLLDVFGNKMCGAVRGFVKFTKDYYEAFEEIVETGTITVNNEAVDDVFQAFEKEIGRKAQSLYQKGKKY